jgi:hypothetical protein
VNFAHPDHRINNFIVGHWFSSSLTLEKSGFGTAEVFACILPCMAAGDDAVQAPSLISGHKSIQNIHTGDIEPEAYAHTAHRVQCGTPAAPPGQNLGEYGPAVEFYETSLGMK